MTNLEHSIQAKLILMRLSLIFIALSLPTSAMSFPGFPRNELPFCPGGGPPGWLNHFDYKRDQNIRRRYPAYQSPFLRPYYNRPPPHNAAYNRAYPNNPYSYAPRARR